MEERTIAGRYRLTARIGAGGMGVVWRAEDNRLRRIVAVKELLTRNGFDADSARRAVREGRIAARLQHANVIALYDVVEDEGRPWLVMEYLPSRSLASILADQGTLPVDEVRRIGRQLAAGLASAHEAGVVHRDVKPGNVLVTEFGTVKVTDFGTSRVAGEGTLTGSGLLVGTPAYLAPEVARGGEMGFPADVFGVGATLYTALEGTPPFGLDGNPIVLLHRAAEGKYAPPENAGSLAPVLTRLLDPDPDTRPSMAEAVRMLTEDSADPPTVLASALPVAAATRIVAPPVDPPAPADPRAPADSSASADAPASADASAPADVPAPADAPPPVDASAPTDAPTRVDAPPVEAPVAPAPVQGSAGPQAPTVPAATPPAPTVPAATPLPRTPPAGSPPVHLPPDEPTSDSPEKKRRPALIAVGVVALLAVALVLLLNRDNGQSPGGQASDTGTPSDTATVEPTGEVTPTEPPRTEPPRTTTEQQPTTSAAQPTTPSAAPQPVGPGQALRDYYALLPGNTEAGFARLTDRFKSGRGLTPAGYRQFWSNKAAQLSDIQENGNQVTATVTYVRADDGSTIEQERNVYTLVQAGDGWAIDAQQKVG
ncbi:protein kinase domain-containing protein [Actinosynnema sp. CS-041913]|uniref:serine/threonine-protein kinase n=1 Tax=Actinosynnema sp. CS-041913 TaxID=3239917 RepID=UPI003D90900F